MKRILLMFLAVLATGCGCLGHGKAFKYINLNDIDDFVHQEKHAVYQEKGPGCYTCHTAKKPYPVLDFRGEYGVMMDSPTH